jgi:hydrogenase maturation factor
VALSGAKPKWFTCTLLLPPKITDETLVNQIFDDIALECKKLGIAVIGGHTEITIDLNRPLAIGTMIGEVSKSNLITTFGGKPGDALLLTRGVAIEGCAIISVEKEQFLLEKGISQEIINLGKSRLHNPGICIVRDAALLTENFAIHAMHDPTEGGLAMGVVELAQNSNCGAILEEKRIPLIEPTQLLCNLLDINPFNLIASGCILFAVDPLIAQNIIKFMAKYDVLVSNIGILTGEKGNFQLKHKNNTLDPLNYSPTDELLKIL